MRLALFATLVGKDLLLRAKRKCADLDEDARVFHALSDLAPILGFLIQEIISQRT